VTTFVDMPLNSDPATTTAALLGAKRRASKVPTPPRTRRKVQGSVEQGSPVGRACRPCCNRPCGLNDRFHRYAGPKNVQVANVATYSEFFIRGGKPSRVQGPALARACLPSPPEGAAGRRGPGQDPDSFT